MTHPPKPAQHARAPLRQSWPLWAMLGVLLLAAYLRVHDLNAQGLWGDEGWSIWLARGDTLRDLTMTMVYDHHGPVYSTLLRGWELIAGETVLALRFITALFSIASIALIYALGRQLLSPAAGVGAALAFALMDKHVVLTQEVRDYPMIFFVMLLIGWFYARWRHNPDQSGNAFGFVAASVIGLYLHYYCYMLNIALLIHAGLTLRDRGRWRHFGAQNVLIALAFLPWLPVVVNQFLYTPVDSDVLNIHGMPLNRHTIEYLSTESLGKPIALYGLLMLAGIAAPFITRIPNSLRHLPQDRRVSAAWFGALWVGVPLAITLSLHSRYPLLTDRNISVIMPGIALLVGFGFLAFEQYGTVFIVALVLLNNLTTTSSYFDKPPWREMAADIAAYYPGDEPVLMDVEGAHAALWYHLSLELPVDVDTVVNLLPEEAEGVDLAVSLYDLRKRYRGDFIPALQRAIDDKPGMWLAYWGDETKKSDSLDTLEAAGYARTATLAYDHHGNAIYAYRYDRADALDEELARFGDSITLRRAEWKATAAPGDTFNVLLWWSAGTPLEVDYTVSVFLLDQNGILRAQHDAYPMNGAAPTSGWQPGGMVFDGHTIALPDDLPPGAYTVGVKLYTWWDGAVIETAERAEYQVLGQLMIQ